MAQTFPTLPFDSQVFIDAFRVKWVYDQSANCWMRRGSVPDVPIATELQPGLLSARLKQLLDGIPPKGGHFGIIAQPLLSLASPNPKTLLKDKVFAIAKTESGTTITGEATQTRTYKLEQFAGKLLRFKTGLLSKKVFLIFTNNETDLFLDGDASEVSKGDRFEVLEPIEFNPSGVLLGDIMLVSESIDITCVDGNGELLPANCNLDVIQCDDPQNPPGLNFQLNKNFLDNLCVIIPGCEGPRGEKGKKGEKGDDGTGDGPQGEQGDPGENAPAIADTFSSIKIIDIDDIFDTAVVALELDAAAGKLGVVKAKIKTPGNNTPATQVRSTPINRAIRFTNPNTFDYELLAPPTTDPIGEADVDLLKYPDKFESESGISTTNVNKISLSELIDKVTEFYEDKLVEANDQYNKTLKEYIDSKDEAARTILANLADELARCEFQLPIDLCIGISPGDCNPNTEDETASFSKSSFIYPLANALFGVMGDKTAVDLGTYIVKGNTDSKFIKSFLRDSPPLLSAAGTPLSVGNIDAVSIKYPNAEGETSTTTLPPAGYVIQYLGGTIKSSTTDYLVGSTVSGVGVEIDVVDGGGPKVTEKMPVPSTPFNAKEAASVELAYKEAPIEEKVIVTTISDPDGGTIKIRSDLPGVNGIGEIRLKVLQVDLS